MVDVSVGLEPERHQLIASNSPWEAWAEVWNPTGYRHGSFNIDYPSREPDFAEAAARLFTWLDGATPDPPRWVMEVVAAHMTRHPPPISTTDDFVVYALAESDELTASLRWVLPADLQRTLEAKHLLVDDPDKLEGAPTYGWDDKTV